MYKQAQLRLGIVVVIIFWLGPLSCISLQEPKLSKPSLLKSVMGQELNNGFQLYVRQEQISLLRPGQITILTLLNTNCPPCGEVVRQLNILKQKSSIEFSLYGMALYSNDPLVIKDIIASYRPLFPIASVAGGLRIINSEQSRPFNEVSTVPITYLIDDDGHLIESFFGFLPLRYIKKLLNSHSLKNNGKTEELKN